MEESRERGEHSFNDPEQFISVFDLSVTTVFQNCGPCSGYYTGHMHLIFRLNVYIRYSILLATSCFQLHIPIWPGTTS